MRPEGEQEEEESTCLTHRVVDHKTIDLDPFIVIDDFSMRHPAAFLDHPHRGFESATFVLPEQDSPQSRLLYYDSTLGQEEKALGPGGLSRMVCGRGISHCVAVQQQQQKDDDDGDEEDDDSQLMTLRAINWWFNYPQNEKYGDPWSGFYEMDTDDMPVVQTNGVRTIVLQDTMGGITGRCFESCPVPLECAHVTLSASRSCEIRVPEGWNGIVYSLRGSGRVNGKQLRGCEYCNGDHEAHHRMVSSIIGTACSKRLMIDDDDDDDEEEGGGNDDPHSSKHRSRTTFRIATTDSVLELLYISGEPVGLPMIVFDTEDSLGGTFVVSEACEVDSGLRDWRNATNGFEYRHTWSSPIVHGLQHDLLMNLRKKEEFGCCYESMKQFFGILPKNNNNSCSQ